jgi:hypothetical protein
MKSVPASARFSPTICWSLIVVGMLSGCSRPPKEAELAEVSGVVAINGKPLPNILVQFLPVVKSGDQGPTSSGVTDEQGEFELETSGGKPGAVVGPCKVLFIDMMEERVAQGTASLPPRISSSLATVRSGTKEVEVKSEGSRFKFDLAN